MTQGRYRLAAAVLALLVTTLSLPAAAPKKCTSTTHASKQRADKSKLIPKTYSLAQLFDKMPDGSERPDLIKNYIMRAVQPKSWTSNGGSANIQYVRKTRTFRIEQTAAGHRQIGSVLKAVSSLIDESSVPCDKCAGSTYSDLKTLPKAAPSGQESAYGHLVLDNVRVNAMGVNCNIKRVRLMFKGNSNLADVAKSAVANGEAGKPQGMANLLNAMLEGVGVCSTPRVVSPCAAPPCGAPPCGAAPIYSSGPYAMPSLNAGMVCPTAPEPAVTTVPACPPTAPSAPPSVAPPGPISTIPNTVSPEKKDERVKR